MPLSRPAPTADGTRTIGDVTVQPTRPTLGLVAVVSFGAAIAGIIALIVGIAIVGTDTTPLPGIVDPGALVTWGARVTRVLTDFAAFATVGLLLSASLIAPTGRSGVLSPIGRRHTLLAALTASAWAILALLQTFFQLAYTLGLPLGEAIQPSILSLYVTELETTRVLLITVLIMSIVVAGLLFTSTTGAALTWLLVALIAVALPGLTGHSSATAGHELALTAGVTHILSAALWVGGLFAVFLLSIDLPQDDFGSFTSGVKRFSFIALICILLLATSGLANATTRLDSLGQLISTGYGQVVLIKTLLILVLGAFGYAYRRRVIPRLTGPRRGAFVTLAVPELLLMGLAIGLGVSLATSPYPKIEDVFASLGESLLGFAYPPPPTPVAVILGFYPDALFLTGALAAAALYVLGYYTVRKAGIRWPAARLASWLTGIGTVIWSTNSGIAIYSQVSVGLHMTQHMALTMLGPILLVLGAPMTLALRALAPSTGHERGPREWLVWFLHSPVTRVLTNPFFVLIVYVLALYGLYLTPLFGWLMGSHVGHVTMQLHFVMSGYLFYWVLIGIDPRPKPLPYWARLLLLLVAMAIHGFFAVALMMGTTPLAVEWYGLVQPEWIVDPLQDTLYGGQVTWGLAEIPNLVVLIAIAVQWSRSDDREARRQDRQADRDDDAELRAYNEYLASLSHRNNPS